MNQTNVVRDTYDPHFPEALQQPPNIEPRQVTPLPQLPSRLTSSVSRADASMTKVMNAKYLSNIFLSCWRNVCVQFSEYCPNSVTETWLDYAFKFRPFDVDWGDIDSGE